MKQFILYSGMVAAAVVPLFNIPFILRIRRNKSSRDVSKVWTAGVWICAVLMLPQAVASEELSFKLFGIINFILFSAVAFSVWKYR